MKIQYVLAVITAPILFSSCQKTEKKELNNTPDKMEKKAQPTAKKQPAKTGIPAVEAARRIGTGLDKEAQKSKDLLDSARGQ